MIKAGLIGYPLRNSLSPLIFKILSARSGARFEYSLLNTRGPALSRTLERMKALGWSGCNVTLPLKEKIIPFLDAVSGEARALGAVNAVRIKNGRLCGCNTDVSAVRFALKEAGCRPRGRESVIWGAGGAARAAAWALARGGAVAVEIHNRTARRGTALAREFSALFPRTRFAARAFGAVPGAAATIFVNATPLGMYGPLARGMECRGPSGSFYLDFAYGRRGTPFLERRDGTAIAGLDLLVYQALKSAEWFGGPRAASREIVKLKNDIKRCLAPF